MKKARKPLSEWFHLIHFHIYYQSQSLRITHLEPPYRAWCVRELKKMGYENRKEKYQYGMRWVSEGYFSAIKCIFKEDIRATIREGMVQEMKMKFLFYNLLAQME